MTIPANIQTRIQTRLTQLRFFGIAISACWILGVTFYQRQIEFPKAQDFAMTAYFICTEHKAAAGDHDIAPCVANVGKDWDKWMNRKWPRIATIVLVPIAAGWLIGFIGIRLYRRKQDY